MVVIFVAYLLGLYVGSHHIYMAADVRKDGSLSMWYPHAYNEVEALRHERELANALFEGLHRFYSNDDNDLWFESFMRTKEYHKIDSLLNGDWEDFYYYETHPLEFWYSEYGSINEPDWDLVKSLDHVCKN